MDWEEKVFNVIKRVDIEQMSFKDFPEQALISDKNIIFVRFKTQKLEVHEPFQETDTVINKLAEVTLTVFPVDGLKLYDLDLVHTLDMDIYQNYLLVYMYYIGETLEPQFFT